MWQGKGQVKPQGQSQEYISANPIQTVISLSQPIAGLQSQHCLAMDVTQ